MKIRCTSSRFLLALVAALLLPLSAQAAPNGRFAKLDRGLRAVAAAPNPGPQHVIIQTRSAADRAALKQALLAHGDVIEAEHPSLNALTVKLHGDDLGALDLDPGVTVISTDAEVTVTGAMSLTSAAAARSSRTASTLSEDASHTMLPSTLRQTLGLDGTVPYTGKGVGIAIIDSGIDPNGDFSGRIGGFWDFTKGGVPAMPHDDYGHGTHVAGLIASSGVLSNGQFRGIAPSARLVILKVLDSNGRGKSSDVIKAIEFVIANKRRLGIDMINLSLGHAILEPAATDPLVRAVQSAARAGIVVMVAAGNAGANQTGKVGYAGITSPGNAPSALTAGAVDTKDTVLHGDDRVAWFSSRGPTWLDAFAKPDFVAPGVALTSDAPRFAALYAAYPQLRKTARNGSKRFAVLSGTSMAAAVATGVGALVIEANRFEANHLEGNHLEGNHLEESSLFHSDNHLSPNMVKAMLQFSALPVVDADALTQGTGEVNVQGATRLAAAYRPLDKTFARIISPTTSLSPDEPSIDWAQALTWGTRLIGFDDSFSIDQASIYTAAASFDGENIVWGTALADGENIVWGTAADVENIVWGTNIVWSSNIVWSDRLVGTISTDGKNIVWGTVNTADGENIVWGTMAADGENIVWGTMAADGENIVWGTSSADGENIVWGTSLADSENIVWGTSVMGSNRSR